MATEMIQHQIPNAAQSQSHSSAISSPSSDDTALNETQFESSGSHSRYDVVEHRGDGDVSARERKPSIYDFELLKTLGTGMLQILD